MLGCWCCAQAEFSGDPSRADQIAQAVTWTWIAGYGFRCIQDPAKGGLQIGCIQRNALITGLQTVGVVK